MKTNEYRMRSFLTDYTEFNFLLQKSFILNTFNISLAGGAVRDYILNKPIADFDIYIWPDKRLKFTIKQFSFIQDVCDVIKDLNFFAEIQMPCLEDEVYNDFSVLNTESDCGKIQIIISDRIDHPIFSVMDHPMYSFDCTLSQMAIYKNELLLPKSTIYDIKTKILRFKANTSQRYIDKLALKYPDYRIYVEKEVLD